MQKYYILSYNSKELDFEYKEGQIYEIKGELKIGECGFHFCDSNLKIFNHFCYSKNFKLIQIEPLGKIITDDDLCMTDKIRIIKIHSHDESRELLKTVGYEYSKDDLILFHKQSDEFSENFKYNKNGKAIYYANSRGYEEWNNYDKKGRMIYRRTSNKDEEWYEYDDNNCEVHYKDSDGTEECYEFDGQE